mmetsp:Transcript_10095/g.26142  ORF Transcript_10095/g.26142 Transcript_10095/m.26142 type:complete len:286 (+) Transcript_10095:43-900(+)
MLGISEVLPSRLLLRLIFLTSFVTSLYSWHPAAVITPAHCTQSSSRALLERLRAEPWLSAAEVKLDNHPYIIAAESGLLTIAQRRAFVGEQYSIQMSDARSFAVLAGHKAFVPERLAGAKVPSAVRHPASGGREDLFQYLLGGEVYAADLLLAMAKQLGLSEEQCATWPITAQAQAYPSYWARLALSRERAKGAAAVAVNFVAWGRMCRRLYAALASLPAIYNASADELAFIGYFGEEMPTLDDMAVEVLSEAACPSYEGLATAVRLVQENELAFWDAVFAVYGT